MNQVFHSDIQTGNSSFFFSMNGQPTVSVNVVGSIDAGHYTPEVSDDKDNWYPISVYNPAGNEVATITISGIFRADVNGYQYFRLHPSSDFAGSPTVQYFGCPTAMISQLSEAAVNNDLLALAWQAGTYPVNSVVLHNGTFWVSNQSTSLEPGVGQWTSYATLAAALTYIMNLFNPQ